MRCYVVAEGPTDIVLLQELLKPEFDAENTEVVFIDGGGWSGAETLARSILAVKNKPVALVVDADSSDPESIAERRGFLESSLGAFGRQPWKVFLCVPQLESLLFEDEKLIEDLVGKPVSLEQFIRGKYEPRKILDQLANGRSRAAMLQDHISQVDLTTIRSQPLVRELKDFLESVTQEAIAH